MISPTSNPYSTSRTTNFVLVPALKRQNQPSASLKKTVSDVFIERHSPKAIFPKLFDLYKALHDETGLELSSIRSAVSSLWHRVTHFLSQKWTYLQSAVGINFGRFHQGDITKPMYDMVERQALFAPLKLASLQNLNPSLRQAIKRTRFFNVPALGDIELAAWHLPAKPGQPTVLFNHGRNSNISSYGALYRTFQSMGYGIFSYDYPGFGKSEGKPSVETIHHAAIAAQEELISRGVFAKQQIIMGHSLGGAVAVDLAYRLTKDKALLSRYRPKALVLINTLSKPNDLMRSQAQEYRLYFHWLFERSPDFLKPFPQIKTFFDLDRKIMDITRSGIPTLVLHGNKDAVFPEVQGFRLARTAQDSASAGTPVLYKKLEGGHYLDRALCAQLPDSFKNFVSKVK